MPRAVLPVNRKLRRLITALCTTVLAPMVFASQVSAQGANREWEWQNPLPQGNAISAIRFAADKMHGWAVGADGVILHTADGGFRWESQYTRQVGSLNGIWVNDRRRAIVVGSRGLVLRTTNGGQRWIRVQTSLKDHLYSVGFAPDDSSRGWAVGSYGSIIATTDAGLTWVQQKSPTSAHLYSVAFANKTLGLAVGDHGTLLRTTDGGAHWKEQMRLGTLPFTSVTFVN